MSDPNSYEFQRDQAAREANLKSSGEFVDAQVEFAGAAAGAAVAVGAVGLGIGFKIIKVIVIIAGMIIALLPGLILGLLYKIPVIGKVLHTAVFAVIITIFLVMVGITVGTALGQQYDGITLGFFTDVKNIIDKAWDQPDPQTGESTGSGMGLKNAIWDTYYIPSIVIPCLALGLLAAIMFFWRKFYHWIKGEGIGFVVLSGAILIGSCVLGSLIGLILGKIIPNAIWIKGLVNCVFIAIAFLILYKEALINKPLSKKEIEQMTRAAEAGDPKAQSDLGYAYMGFRGDNIERDVEKAIMWTKKSAAQGFKDAINYLPVLYDSLKRE